jgi:prepilin-type N-terminal cleavage/methylation domain-containing protein
MNKKGFTLAEVAVTLSILSIMAAISIPTYISWLPKHRLITSVRQIYDDLNLAKMEAVKNNQDVFVKFYRATETYSVYLDSNNNGTLDTGTDFALKKNVALEQDVTITSTNFLNDTIGFNNRGMVVTGFLPGQVNVTNPTGVASGVTVNLAGGIIAFP